MTQSICSQKVAVVKVLTLAMRCNREGNLPLRLQDGKSEMYPVSMRVLLVALVVQMWTSEVAAIFVSPDCEVLAGTGWDKVVGWSLTAGNASVAWCCMPASSTWVCIRVYLPSSVILLSVLWFWFSTVSVAC